MKYILQENKKNPEQSYYVPKPPPPTPPALPMAVCTALEALIKLIIVLMPRDRLSSHRIPSPRVPATESLTSTITNHQQCNYLMDFIP
jgi:hypothetical protein